MGFLAAGNDLASGMVSVEEAEERCGSMEDCVGFTFKHGVAADKLDALASGKVQLPKGQAYTMYMKAEGSNFISNEGWFTWMKLPPEQEDSAADVCHGGTEENGACQQAATEVKAGDVQSAEISTGATYKVDVIRQDPLVALVHDFTTDEECQYMVNKARPHLTPAQARRTSIRSFASPTQPLCRRIY